MRKRAINPIVLIVARIIDDAIAKNHMISSQDIADRLNLYNRLNNKTSQKTVTRNQIISMCIRNNITLPKARKSKDEKREGTIYKKSKRVKPDRAALRNVEFLKENAGPNAVSLMDARAHHCRWMHEDICCGDKIWRASYCEKHYRIAHTKTSE